MLDTDFMRFCLKTSLYKSFHSFQQSCLLIIFAEDFEKKHNIIVEKD